MRRIGMAIAAAAIGAALLFAPARASAAGGLAASASQIDAAARASLRKDIEAYRVAHPEVFEAIRELRGIKPEVYRTFRNPIPLVGRELRALGPSALLPMLDALAFEAPATQPLTRAEKRALVVGLLEAVGVLRDPRSGPVLRAVLDASAGDERVAVAAAEAMGRLCGDAELNALVEHTAEGDALRLAAIQGLGACKRIESAKHLAALLAGASDEAVAQTIGAALGSVGSSWAWKAMGPDAEAAGDAVRAVAAKALVQGFVRFAGEQARSRFEKSLGMVEHPAAIEAIDAARPSASVETRAALDALAARLASRKR